MLKNLPGGEGGQTPQLHPPQVRHCRVQTLWSPTPLHTNSITGHAVNGDYLQARLPGTDRRSQLYIECVPSMAPVSWPNSRCRRYAMRYRVERVHGARSLIIGVGPVIRRSTTTRWTKNKKRPCQNSKTEPRPTVENPTVLSRPIVLATVRPIGSLWKSHSSAPRSDPFARFP